MVVEFTQIVKIFHSLQLRMVIIVVGITPEDVMHQFLRFNFAVILIENVKSGTKYTFESSTGKLSKISAVFEEDTVTVQYLNQSYPSLLTHSNGKQMAITYHEDKVIYIDLKDEDSTILKSRYRPIIQLLSHNLYIKFLIFSIYSYSGDYLTSVTVGGRSTLYNYSSGGDLTGVHFASGERRTWTYDEMNLINGTTVYNEDIILASIGLSQNWNGRITMTTQPQNVTAELLYDTTGKVISGTLPGGVRFVEETSVAAGSTVKSYKFGDQVRSYYYGKWNILAIYIYKE